MKAKLLMMLVGAVTFWGAVALAWWVDWRLGVAMILLSINVSIAVGYLGNNLLHWRGIVTATNRRVDDLELRTGGNHESN